MGQEDKKITFVLTSCGRFDLLEKTLRSFFQHEDAKLMDRFILTEDSCDEGVYDVLEKFPQAEFEVIFNNPYKGQMLSIDSAYEQVKTPYIFHCEDDWEFTKPDFVKPSLVLLEDFPKAFQVLIRDPKTEFINFEHQPLLEHKGIKHRDIDGKKLGGSWYGLSFNPGLRRTADQMALFPFSAYTTEAALAVKVKRQDYYQIQLENGGVVHIGEVQHLLDVHDVRKPFVKRMKNSILKRLNLRKPDEDEIKEALPISCFIITGGKGKTDEEKIIARALASVKYLVDEIIIVDSGATDSIAEVAKKYGAQVFCNEWKGEGSQKRFAEEKCRNNWLLNIDADEWFNRELADSIRRLFEKGEPSKAVWCVQRGDIYFGDRHLRKYMNLEKKPRLYDKRRARSALDNFAAPLLPVNASGAKKQTGLLYNGVLLHPFHNMADMMKQEVYDAQAGMQDKLLIVLLFRLFVDFPQCFLKHYFLRYHILMGKKGFIYSMVRGYGRFLRTAMELEKKLNWAALKIKGKESAAKSLWDSAQKEIADNTSKYADKKNGKRVSALGLWLEMPLSFLKFYILRGMIFNGLQGFCYAIIYSFSRFDAIVRQLEKMSSWIRLR